jgi:hypothetical protein
MQINRTKINVLVICAIFSACIFLSCRKNSQPSWDTQILAPIVSTSLSINDIITSSYLTKNSDSSVSLVYNDSLYNLNIDTILTIPDTVLSYNYVYPFPTSTTVVPGGLLFYSKPTTTTYPIGSVQLVKGTLLSGYLIFTVKNPLSQPVDYVYKVCNVTNTAGDTLEVKVEVNEMDSLTEQIPLNGYIVDFTGPSHNGYNDITTSIQVNLDPSAGSLSLSAPDVLSSAEVSFKQIIPYYAKGYFGTTTKVYGPENIAFPVFNKIVSGNLNLQNVSVNLSISNSFGIDASLELTQLSSYNSRTNTTVNLTDNAIIGSTIHINRAVETNNPATPVDPSVMNFAITPSNSNILAWFDNLPTAVGYALQVETDPLGNISGSNDFAYYGYGINSVINISIPLSLIANNLTLADTLGVNFAGAGQSVQHVKSGTLTLYASNGFPFSAGLQLYLLNQNGAISDSLFIPVQTILPAPINNITGKVTSPQNSTLTISLDASRTQELFNTKRIILYARFNMGSAPSSFIKIYDYYQLGIKMVGNFDYQIN